jgi:hypothetical protein
LIIGEYIAMRATIILSALVALSSCSSAPVNRSAAVCAARKAPNARTFDKARPEVLVGRYEFTMVSAWEEAAGRWSRGELEIWQTPGGKVQGSSDIDLDSLMVPGQTRRDPSAEWLGSGDLLSRDTLNAGLVYHSLRAAYTEAHFLLAPIVTADGSQSWLEVDSLSDMGFWGRWDSDLGLISIVKEGRILPNPHGTFCARRLLPPRGGVEKTTGLRGPPPGRAFVSRESLRNRFF